MFLGHVSWRKIKNCEDSCASQIFVGHEQPSLKDVSFVIVSKDPFLSLTWTRHQHLRI